jgi:hypothetical protein
MGLILDSSVVIAADRQGHSVLQILEQLNNIYGEIGIGRSVVSIAELTHGAYRARTDVAKKRRIAFVDRLCSDIPVHPFTVEVARGADISKRSRLLRVSPFLSKIS